MDGRRPATIDIWDLKPGAPTGGPFKPIATTGDVQICEHMPLTAKQMHHLSIVRSMSTREADHNRGRYYMHTGYVPNPNIEHPSYGSVVSHELAEQTRRRAWRFRRSSRSAAAASGPGFLGMTYAPFVVNTNGDVRNLKMGIDDDRLDAADADAGLAREELHQAEPRPARPTTTPKILDKTVGPDDQQADGSLQGQQGAQGSAASGTATTGFGRGCLMARRLVEAGVPFVEVDLGGWDTHANIFTHARRTRSCPSSTRRWPPWSSDLDERGLLQDTAIIWMGEFGRTPRINGNAGRDHWARSWSVVVGGAGMKGGIAVGKTNDDGTDVDTEPYTSQDVMATVCKALGISLETTFTSKNGRPMKIANSGKVIEELFA